MMALAVLIGAFIVEKDVYYTLNLLLGTLTAFSLTGASMITNDYWDRDVDAINEPTRVIPSGKISIDRALIYAAILITIGLISAYITNVACLFTATISIFISLFYNTKGKQWGFLGNLMVSACVAISFIYGGFIYKGLKITKQEFNLISSFALMAFLSNTGREITKGIADIEGDKLRNVKTVAIKYGSKTASYLSFLFYIFTIALSVFVWFLDFVSWPYLPFVIVADIGFIISSVSLLNDCSKENAKKVKKRGLSLMLIGLLAFIAGGF